jgi:hypothetical protein
MVNPVNGCGMTRNAEPGAAGALDSPLARLAAHRRRYAWSERKSIAKVASRKSDPPLQPHNTGGNCLDTQRSAAGGSMKLPVIVCSCSIAHNEHERLLTSESILKRLASRRPSSPR